jgi:hypothetical protein
MCWSRHIRSWGASSWNHQNISKRQKLFLKDFQLSPLLSMDNSWFRLQLNVFIIQEEVRACLERDQHRVGLGIIKELQWAPAYMLTNLVDATTTFHTIDIPLYMMELLFSFSARIIVRNFMYMCFEEFVHYKLIYIFLSPLFVICVVILWVYFLWEYSFVYTFIFSSPSIFPAMQYFAHKNGFICINIWLHYWTNVRNLTGARRLGTHASKSSTTSHFCKKFKKIKLPGPTRFFPGNFFIVSRQRG